MNNLHRELAPISDSAWAQIEEETTRTLKRYLAGRRVVDLKGPAGTGLSATHSTAGSAEGAAVRRARRIGRHSLIANPIAAAETAALSFWITAAGRHDLEQS